MNYSFCISLKELINSFRCDCSQTSINVGSEMKKKQPTWRWSRISLNRLNFIKSNRLVNYINSKSGLRPNQTWTPEPPTRAQLCSLVIIWLAVAEKDLSKFIKEMVVTWLQTYFSSPCRVGPKKSAESTPTYLALTRPQVLWNHIEAVSLFLLVCFPQWRADSFN